MKMAIFLIMLFNTGCAIHERNAYLEAENKALRAIVETDEIDLSQHARYEIHESSRGLLVYSSERRCVRSTGSNLHAPFYELSDVKISGNKITAIGINTNDFSSASAPKEYVTPARGRITVTAKKYSRIREVRDGFITEFTGTILVQDDP
jgi:hypothetical protein